MSTVLTIQEYDQLKDSITGIIAYADGNSCIAGSKVMDLLIQKDIISLEIIENKEEINNEWNEY